MKNIILLFMLLASCNLFAIEKTHTIRVLLGNAKIQTNLESEEDVSKIHNGIIYDYQFDSNWGISTGLTEASGELCYVTCGPSKREMSYKSIQLSAKWQTQMSMRWYAKGQLGLNRYTVNFFGNNYWSDEDLSDIKSTEVKPFAAVGLELRAHNGFMFGLEIQHLPMDIIDVTSHNLTVGFSF